MKRNYLKIAALTLLVTFSNCSKDEAEPINVTPPVADVPVAEMEADMKADLALDESTEDIYTLLQKTSTIGAKGLETIATVDGACTVTGKVGSQDYMGVKYFSYTYDYGTGCTQANGRVVKGVIKLLTISSELKDLVFLFENYSNNGKVINGSIALKKEPSGDKQAKITTTQNLTATLPNIGEFKREGVVTRTFIKGFDTAEDKTDDIFETTGYWTTTFPDKTTNIVKISKALKIELGCPVKKHNSGTIEFTRKGNVAVIDFGDATCTAKWKITKNSITKEITKE